MSDVRGGADGHLRGSQTARWKPDGEPWSEHPGEL
jgi:hypothetical protein